MIPGWAREVLRRPAGVFGAVVIALLVAAAIVSVFWTPRDPFAADPFQRWLGPSAAHPFGTDGVGRDILSYVLAATRTTVLVAALSSVVAALVGLVLAAIAALGPRWVREPLAVLIDVLIAFPVLLIAIMLSAVLGSSLGTVIAAVGIGFGVNIARVSRGEIRRVARAGYVLAARASGLGPVRTLLDHVLPNIAPVFIVQLSLSAGVAVLSEAGLSFLGYGAPPSRPSWGRLLSDLQDYVTVHPLTVVWPGLAITLSVLAFNLFGDALREATDPRLRSRRRIAR
ncbi:ABC transporter permease [Amnibacterium kyonggiense]|uniref:Peptide/nickel transport system permease protein n=1 Tax=Amnibacterium kyonggiense TaxID=595671 RepID=A0A4R7FR12_9MICO|nr:ABC transporter permease [Amnibacterium kyonggiense]TDS80240.1 peptide/nickel transport system permease protein [Amnibacterium kyonggiense]